MTKRGRWPDYSEEEIEAVVDCLRRGDVNGLVGDEVSLFEREFAEWAGARYAIALANGTVALDLALWGLDLPRGGEVIVTPRSYVASASCVVNAGLAPVFADVDRATGNVSSDSIAMMLSDKTVAIVVVHLNGWPCDMTPILELAKQYGIPVIEDCAQAHGARYRGRSVGTLGDVGAWSFCQDKILSTGGEGGMVTCDDLDLAERMWSLKDHGKSRAAMDGPHPPGFRWVVEHFGTNWRLTGPQAAIGRKQLRKISVWTKRRSHIATRLTEALSEYSCVEVPFLSCDGCDRTCKSDSGCTHAYYRLQAWLVSSRLTQGWSQDRIIGELNTILQGDVMHGPCPEIYREAAFRNAGYTPNEGRLTSAAKLGETSLLFKIYPTMTDQQIDDYVEAIGAVFSEACSDNA